jgi:four helix bundle protein
MICPASFSITHARLPQTRGLQRAHRFALEIRSLAGQFPPGYSELRAQIIRAGESIPANIVEGCGAATKREFARYLDIAIKSSSEVEYHLLLARDCGIMRSTDWSRLTAAVIEIRKMLHRIQQLAVRLQPRNSRCLTNENCPITAI